MSSPGNPRWHQEPENLLHGSRHGKAHEVWIQPLRLLRPAAQPCLQFQSPGELYNTLVSESTPHRLQCDASGSRQMIVSCSQNQEPSPFSQLHLLLQSKPSCVQCGPGSRASVTSGSSVEIQNLSPGLLNQILHFNETPGCVGCMLNCRQHQPRL